MNRTETFINLLSTILPPNGTSDATKMTRRGFFAVTSVAAAAALSGCKPAVESNYNIETNTSNLIFLAPEDILQRKFVITANPEILELNFSPVQDRILREDQPDPNINRILFRLSPSANPDKENEIWADLSEIKAKHAVRVLGGTYPHNGGLGRINVQIGNENRVSGIWYVLTDKDGNLVNINSEQIKPEQKPTFVAATYSTVISKKEDVNPQKNFTPTPVSGK